MKTKRRALAERREILGHSQEKLAEILGVELTTVGRWERGETSPLPWSRPKLADALKVSLEELNRLLTEGQPTEVYTSDGADEPSGDPENDPVLSAPWSHRGTVEVAVVLSGGGRVERRHFVFLTGAALTAPAHQWLINEPGQAAREGQPAEAVTLVDTAVTGVRGRETASLLTALYSC